MGDKIKFGKGGTHDEIGKSDSDAEYSEEVKKMLASTRNKHRRDAESEDELYAFSDSEQDSDGEQHNADSDIERANDDDLPDQKAWGRHKGTFYSTDFVDQDYGAFNEHEEKVAEREEIEARAIQERLAKELDEQDFTLDIFRKKPDKDEEVEQTFVKADLSSLSHRQKQQLFLKESPEFIGIVDDLKAKTNLLHKYLTPIKKLYDDGNIKASPATEFVICQYNLILNYCNNILFYLLLKSKRLCIQNHPIVKRLYQYRQLLGQLDPIFNEVIQPQIEEILSNEKTNQVEQQDINKDYLHSAGKKIKKLSLLENVTSIKPNKRNIPPKVEFGNEKNTDEVVEPTSKKSKIGSLSSSDEDDEDVANEESVTAIEEGNAEGEVVKRGITYQIAKNKGLMPKRKKEQRNPRVKNRNKFRKAKIRRKGAVREVRTELSRYGGEMSGIKASVKKSIKIK